MSYSEAWILRVRRMRRAVLPFLLGALTVLGFAPFYLFFIPVLTLAALFHLWRHAGSRRAAFVIGYLFGLGLFGFGVSWVYVSMHDFGMMPMPIAALATLLFCAFLALFPALAGAAQAWIGGTPGLKFLFLIPALLAMADWVRGWIFTGFPWLAVGYSQAPTSPLAGFAPVFGVYGVSLVLLLSAGLVALAYAHWRGNRRTAALALGGLGLVWIGGFALKAYEWTQPFGKPVSVSLLQGNIPQDLKWREDRLVSTLATYRSLVLKSHSRLIILPETALPLFHDQVPPGYLDELAQHVRNLGGDLVLGLPERNPAQGAYYNSALSVGTAPTQWYRKHHLVPFGEFVPLRPVFGWFIDMMQIPLGDFARGAPVQTPLAVAGQRVAVNICYEDVFGEEIIRQLPQATLLANISNDAWFGESIAMHQHLQISQMRAIETGRPMLRATNTGISAIVDHWGNIQAVLTPAQTGKLEAMVAGRTGGTPYVQAGNTAFLIIVMGLLLYCGFRARNESRRLRPAGDTSPPRC